MNDLRRKTRIALIGSTLDRAALQISELVPNPDNLPGKTLLLTVPEEAALDNLFGMFWGAILGTLIAEKYAGDVDGAELRSFGTQITFPDEEHFLLAFTK